MIRALQRFCVQNDKTNQRNSIWQILHKCAEAMNARIIRNNGRDARVRDFSKNIKALCSKYFYHEALFNNFIGLVEGTLEVVCKCQNNGFSGIRSNICEKSCRAMDFCALADALDAVSQVGYIYKGDEKKNQRLLERMATKMNDPKVWQTLETSQVRNKYHKFKFVLRHFANFSYYPEALIFTQQKGGQTRIEELWQNQDNNLKTREHFVTWMRQFREENPQLYGKLPKQIRSRCENLYENLIQRSIPKLMTMETELFKILQKIFDEKMLQQKITIDRALPYFVMTNGARKICVVPCPRARFCRDRYGYSDRKTGRVESALRILKKDPENDDVICILHSEFDKLSQSEQIEYVKFKLANYL
jgi:hypothetical protein